MYDVAIIGGGIVGAATAAELSRYELRIALIEKENDVACAATRANSGIVHAGYDPPPGSLMAKLNVEGARMMGELCQRLSVHYEQCGSLVLAFDAAQRKIIEGLRSRGMENGVPGLEVISGSAVFEMEPNINRSVVAALNAPSGAIVNPFELCAALADIARVNGTDFNMNSEVTAIERADAGYEITYAQNTLKARYVVNAAGLYSDVIADMAGRGGFKILPSKGEYYLLDKNQGGLVSRVIFQCPSGEGKGVLVSPTVHGNLLVGPNAEDSGRDGGDTTGAGLLSVKDASLLSVPGVDFGETVRTFAGVRARSGREDFIIDEADGFINLAGIKSPGLTSAPAIARMCARLLERAGAALVPKAGYTGGRSVVRVREASEDEKNRLIRQNPLYGRIVCRCETVSEGEVVDAVNNPIAPPSVDAVKRRCNAGMGRCQGGFCGPRIVDIIARERGIPHEDVLQDTEGSYIITGETKDCGGCGV